MKKYEGFAYETTTEATNVFAEAILYSAGNSISKTRNMTDELRSKICGGKCPINVKVSAFQSNWPVVIESTYGRDGYKYGYCVSGTNGLYYGVVFANN